MGLCFCCNEESYKYFKMKKIYLILIAILVLVVLLIVVFRGLSGEDSWIKDSRGVWVKHGNPSETPSKVLEQQKMINDALVLYHQKKSEEMQFSSQCLGTVDDYAVDIVHVPRTQEDNLVENQCEDYRTGKISHFIELDKDGNVVGVV
jgi:uncharacterized protein YpmS